MCQQSPHPSQWPRKSWICFAGKVIQVRALRDITAGGQLTVQYVNLMEPRAVRQGMLAERYFTCACDRCSEPLASSTDRYLEACTVYPRPYSVLPVSCPEACFVRHSTAA